MMELLFPFTGHSMRKKREHAGNYYHLILKTIVITCCLAAVLFHSGNSHAEPPVYDVVKLSHTMNLTPYLEWTNKKAEQRDIHQVVSKKFELLVSSRLGYQTGNTWIRFRVHNSSKEIVNLILNWGDRHVDEIEFFVLSAEDLIKRRDISGISQKFSDRTLKSTAIAFPLSIEAGETQTVLLRIKSEFLIQTTPSLSTYSEFYNSEQEISLTLFGFYGFVFGLIIYNILIWVSTREPEFSSFAIFLCLWSLLIAGNDGFIYRLWPYDLLGGYPSWLYYTIVGGSAISVSLFTTIYLRLKEQAAIYIRLQYAIALFGLLIAAGPLFLSFSSLLFLSLILNVSAIAINTATGWIMYRLGHKNAFEYTFAFGILLTGILATHAMYYGFIGSYSDSEIFFRIGLLFPMLLISIGIGNSINRTKVQTTLLQRQANEANYAAKFKSRFLATMSHEIRTPMNGVLGMTELLKETSLNQMQKQYIEIIDTSGKVLMNVINDILDISKLEQGELDLENISISIEDLLDDCIGIFAALNKRKELAFDVLVSPNTPRFFMGDPTRIKQVLLNLLSNAFKFTHRGEIRIEISLEEKKSQHFVRFSIVDTGIGISPAAQQQLFSAFTQADESISRKYGGTGLGLAICRELADAMQGEISVESTPGTGSAFHFLIPLIEDRRNSDILDDALTTDFKGKRILIIDDNGTFLQTIKHTLESWGLEASTASSCIESKKLLSDKLFDIVLLNNQLADGNGLDLVADIRKSQKTRQFPIVYINSGFDITPDQLLEQFDIEHQLIKPTKFKTLRSVLAEILSPKEISIEMNETYNFENFNVLVVEDNPTNQLVLNGMLSNLGITAKFCDNGKQGFELYTSIMESGDSPLDLVFMDCEMPVMDGYTTTEKIRAYEKTCNPSVPVPILGLSAHAMQDSEKKARDAGMNLYLTKPLKFDDLKKSIAQLCLKDDPVNI